MTVKIANVTPIFKKGSKNLVGNYRPVSLTRQVCKLFEMTIRDSIVHHLDSYGLIKSSQYSFRKSGSCLSNVLEFLDEVASKLDSHKSVDVIYLDCQSLPQGSSSPATGQINERNMELEAKFWFG